MRPSDVDVEGEREAKTRDSCQLCWCSVSGAKSCTVLVRVWRAGVPRPCTNNDVDKARLDDAALQEHNVTKSLLLLVIWMPGLFLLNHFNNIHYTTS